MKRLILTPNKTDICGMYQLAKDLKETSLDGIWTIKYSNPIYRLFPFLDKIDYFDNYDDVITFLYPMHLFGRKAKKQGKRWICYNQGSPPATKQYFPKFWRRQYMKIFNKLNAWSMKGADEYWDVTEREQKPRWTEKSKVKIFLTKTEHTTENIDKYAIYLGRRTDYKNYEWLKNIMSEFKIPLITSDNWNDKEVYVWLSNATMLVTASLWEGFGRPVHESESLGIPAVAYDVGAHRRHIKKGICVPCYDEEAFKRAILDVWNR